MAKYCNSIRLCIPRQKSQGTSVRVRRPRFKPYILEHQSRLQHKEHKVRCQGLVAYGRFLYHMLVVYNKDISNIVTVSRHVINRKAHIFELQLFRKLLSPEVRIFSYVTCTKCRSQWPHCLRRGPEAAHLLGLLFRIPRGP